MTATAMTPRLLLLAAGYFVAGWLGLKIPYTGAHITLVWLPTGIAVAAALRWGRSVWPGVYLGAFLVNLSIGSSWPLAAGIAVGNTLAPLATAHWLTQRGFHAAFDRQRDVGLFVAAACLGMIVSASGGVASLYLAGLLPASAAASAWLTWWMGDAVGVLLAAPLLLTLTRENLVRLTQTAHREWLLWMLVAAPTAWLAFVQDYETLGRTLPLSFLTLPLVAWAALRFGITAAALTGLGFSVVAAVGTATSHGTFFLPDERLSLFLLWAYMTTTVLSGLLIAALQEERLQVEYTLRDSEARLRELLAEQKTMLENELIGIVRVKNRTIEWANPAFEQILGYAPGELVGTPTQRNYPDEDAWRAFGAAAYPVLAAGGIYRAQVEHVRKDGERIWVDISGAMLNPSSGESLWGFIDITERKKTEQALVRAKREAESANLAKSRFLATMSHEIRTPMNGILGMAQLMLIPGLTDDERHEYAQTILDSGQTLLALLNDVLDLSRIDAGRFELRYAQFDPRRTIEETTAMFTGAARTKGLRLEAVWRGPRGRHYVGDSLRLRQMIANLVGNAVKFTRQGFVRAQATEVERTADKALLEFSVEDSGIGIPAEQQSLLFTAFSQLDDSTTREYGGTGLGLSIVRSLAKLMAGEVGVDSEPGKGSRFWFRVWVDTLPDGAVVD